MPTKEELLKLLNNQFQMSSEDFLSEEEREIYYDEEYKNYINNPNSYALYNELNDEYNKYNLYNKYPDKYVEELLKSDDTVLNLNNDILKLKAENLKLDDETKKLTNREKEISTLVKNNNTAIETANKEIAGINARLKELNKPEKDIESAIKYYKDTRTKEIKAEYKYQELIDEYDKKIKAKNREDRDNADKIYEAREQKESELHIQQSKCDILLKDTEVLQKEYDELSAQMAKWKKKDANKYNTLNDEAGMLGGRIQRNKVVYDTFAADIEKMKAEIEDLKKKYSAACDLRAENDKKLEAEKKEKLGELIDKMSAVLDKDVENKTAELTKEYEDAQKRYEDEVKALNEKLALKTESVDKLTKENNELTEESKNNINKVLKNNDLVKDNNRKISVKTFDQHDYAKKLADTKAHEVGSKLDRADKFCKIHKALHNTTPVTTAENILNGLRVVKQAYMNYYNNHSGWGKFFSVFRLNSAWKDYAAYKAVKQQFVRYSNIPDAEIENYIRNTQLGGSIENVANKLTKAEVDKILVTDLVVNKNYSRNPAATVADYLTGIESLNENSLSKNMEFPEDNKIVEAGIIILTHLGDISRSNPSDRVSALIEQIKNSIRINYHHGDDLTELNGRIENALLPANQRKEDTHSYNKEFINKLEDNNNVAINKKTIYYEDIVDTNNLEQDINTNSKDNNQEDEKVNIEIEEAREYMYLAGQPIEGEDSYEAGSEVDEIEAVDDYSDGRSVDSD